MTKKYPGNIPVSIKQRLFNISHKRSVDFQIPVTSGCSPAQDQDLSA